ncbi:carbon storage regulator, partial [Vibrio harveyi]
MLDNSFVAR